MLSMLCYTFVISRQMFKGNPSTPVAFRTRATAWGRAAGTLKSEIDIEFFFLFYARNYYRTTESRGFRRPAWEGDGNG